MRGFALVVFVAHTSEPIVRFAPDLRLRLLLSLLQLEKHAPQPEIRLDL
jgi:hypothetical protein